MNYLLDLDTNLNPFSYAIKYPYDLLPDIAGLIHTSVKVFNLFFNKS